MVWDVFVYGTLRRGFCNHRYLGDSVCCGPARTVAAYGLSVADGIPYLTVDEARYPVAGEVYRVDARTLAALDALEEHPHVYERRLAPVRMDAGETRPAWIYFARHAHGVAVGTGDFVRLPQ
ncbi:gamma-glutamylcyclotransferase family protein [Solidesulfovibrio sp.]